jgi:hypothetical protein
MRTLVRCLGPTVLAALSVAQSSLGAQVQVGQRDDFQNGTTQGWIAGPGGGSPVPPVNVPTGGPGGLNDAYLLIRALGGAGPGSRLSAINFAQWTGNYLAAGVAAITMDVNNLGTTDLFLRLLLADPIAGPPNNIVISLAPIVLTAGSGWTNVMFPVIPSALKVLLGSANGALSNATELRIFHNPDPDFPGPGVGIPPIVADLGVDNITAVDVVPEPSTAILVGSGVLLLLVGARRRKGG